MAVYPLLFQPNMHTVVWGGHRLQSYKGLCQTDDPIGESWEVSAVESSPCIVANGSKRGQSLIDVVGEWGSALLGEAVFKQYGGKLPLLVKFIDAQSDLSIQVHPNDELAAKRHGKFGKTEMWYIIDAEPGAALYAGFKSNIDKEEYKRRVADGTICDVLARHEVRPGDVFYIPAGRVHAICGGVLLAEVQQSSDVTYRIFDYNRPGLDGRPRQLHTEQAIDAIDFNVLPDYRTHYGNTLETAAQVIDTPFFDVRVMDISETFHRNLVKYDSFIISMCIKGACQFSFNGYDGEEKEIVLHEGHSCLIPASIADYNIKPLVKGTRILEAHIDKKDRSLIKKVLRFVKIIKK